MSILNTLLALDYPEYEIILVNDGSVDSTIEKLIEGFDLIRSYRGALSEIPTAEIKKIYRSRRYPNIWVLDKGNAGKADAINAGINHSRTPLFCTIDADTVLDKKALLRAARHFMLNSKTIAVGG